MKCPHCQAENPEGVKFCRECGRSFAMELTCPQYGYKNPQGVTFYYECGHYLAKLASTKPLLPESMSFAGGRYQVKEFLGEGNSMKKV